MHIYDYSFLDNGMLPASLVGLTANIYLLGEKTDWQKENFEEVFTELSYIARVQSVKSSNEIEGIVTTDERIQSIVSGNTAPVGHNEQEIAGYRDALSIVHTEHEHLDFSDADIRRLHQVMLNIAGYAYAGEYKDVDNDIMETDIDGHRRIRFSPVSARETAYNMEQLILAYRDARDNPNINQLLLIPCVILDFLCIHPFRDGNGRISRLLSLLLLYKNGFDVGKYISFEEQINKRKGNYYKALKDSSIGWHDNENDSSGFIMEFLITLYKCYEELNSRFAVIDGRKHTKQARIEAAVLNSTVPISKSELAKRYPDVSTTTIESVLGNMIRDNKIKKVGNGRNTEYIRV
ncbi:MAG: Fic family protein [Eubacterium sp.]|nr:Fic family protein [Eubacterium sp.]